MTMRHLSSRSLAQRGAAAVELGLLTLPLAMLTFGTTDFGRAMHQYDTVVKNVRDAARYQSTVVAGNTLGGRCLALTGTITNNGTACSGTPLLDGLTLAQVTVCDRLSCPGTHNLQPTTRGAVNLVTVTITGFQFTSMVPFAVPNITFGAIRATMAQPI
jgi:Flp pilus assembly protein TadG